MANTIDITDYTDAVVDVLLASRTSESVDCEHLTPKERYQVAEALGWKMTPSVSAWINSAPSSSDPRPQAHDFEGAILARQERDGWVG